MRFVLAVRVGLLWLLVLWSGCGRVGVELALEPGEGGLPDAADAASPPDSDGDGMADALDPCPLDNPNDSDGDGICNSADACPNDRAKTAPGVCGCNADVPAGLVAYFPFDETAGSTASDALQMRLASLFNFASNAWTAGHVNGALGFDGMNDVVLVGSEPVPLRALSFWLSASEPPQVTNTDWHSATSTNAGGAWLQPQNAYQSDNQYTNGGGQNGAAQDWGGFGFVLPAGTAVTGIEVEIESANINLTAGFDVELSFDGGGSHTATRRQGNPPDFDRYDSFGGQSDLWGRAWTASETDDAHFRVQLVKGGVQGSSLAPGVDHIRARLSHSAIPATRPVLALGPGIRLELTGPSLLARGFPDGTVIYVDGVAGGSVGAGFHHVVVTMPSTTSASDVRIGGAADARFFFGGVIDELKLFGEALDAIDITTLRTSPSCR